MVERACNAWKTPARDFSQRDYSTRPEELRRRSSEADPDRANEVEEQLEAWRSPGEIDRLARDLEAKRRAMNADYTRKLENAWRIMRPASTAQGRS
jgi:hypothetical protein